MLKNESCQGLGKYITEFGKILKVNKKVISYFCLLGNQYLSIIINILCESCSVMSDSL